MRFWDTSAIVPLCLPQVRSPAAEALIAQPGDVVVWWGTVVEATSAIARLVRDGTLDGGKERAALGKLDRLRERWREVEPGDVLRERALRVLRVHPLRAADALQLAAALFAVGDEPRGHTFITFDDRLRDAAAREGFITP